MIMAAQTIPVVNLQNFRNPSTRSRFVDTLGRALADIGFFAVENHGVDLSLINKAYALAEKFFCLDEPAKRKYEDLKIKGQRGYTSFGREHAKDAKAPDLKEFYHVGQDLPPNHALNNVYPKNIWPNELPEFREVYQTLYRQTEACALDLLRACALYIGEKEELFSDMATLGNSILRIIHYPPVAADANPQSIRAAAHEDINLITLLCEATAGGLELLERNGDWRPIHALKGQIIADAGDMLQNVTNGFYKSTTHRVVNPDNSRERRFSMPFFVHPRSEVSLNPLQSCLNKTGGKTKFPDITAGAYLEQRLREIGLA
jgi:isopenicillin N synthase-like dioxygenase